MRTRPLLVRCAVLLAIAASPARAGFEGDLRSYDFDGDGKHDLLFVGQPGTGGDRLLRVTRGDAVGGAFPSAIFRTSGGSMRLADAGDVDGDGRDDLVLQGLPLGPGAGVIRVDLTDGATVIGSRFLPDGDGAWTVLGVGDTDGDGAMEILAEAGPSIGQVRIQRPHADGTIEQGFVPTAGGAWRLFGAPDIDGDGRADLVFEGADRSPAAGHLRIDFLAADGLTLAARTFVSSGFASVELRGVGPGLVVMHPSSVFDITGNEARLALRFDAQGAVAERRVFYLNFYPDLPPVHDLGRVDLEGDGSDDWVAWRNLVDVDTGDRPPSFAIDAANPYFCAVPGGGSSRWGTFAAADLDGDGTIDLAEVSTAPTGVGSVRLFLHDGVGDPTCEWTRVVFANGAGAWQPFALPR